MTKTKFILLFFLFTALISCTSNKLSPEPGLFKVSILYPSGEGKTFDMNYYEKTHMPMMAGFLGKNLKFYEIDKGVGGRAPNDTAPFVAVGYFYCYDMAEYNKTIGKNIDAIRKDISNYTNIQPVVQISEIKFLKTGDAK